METTIDRDARNRLAELLRHLLSGRITNDQFQDNLPRRSRDRAVREIINESWYLYDDLREHRLTGPYRLGEQNRPEVSRWILFLNTDLGYQWPTWPRWQLSALNLITFGLVGRLYRRSFRRFGDTEVWPFLARSDYESARSNPTYLAGHAGF